MKKLYFFTLVLLLAIGLGFQSCSSIGEKPSGEYLQQISKSKNYDKKLHKFVNRRQKEMDEFERKMSYSNMFKEFFFGGKKHRTPDEKLPEVKPIFKDFVGNHDDIKFIWFGHSTVLVNMDGKLILIDPVFSKWASPLIFFNTRFQDSVVTLEELPKIDYIVISHDHFDHLDEKAIKHFVNSKTKFVLPLGVRSYLEGWGVSHDRIFDFDWWDQKTLDGIDFTCTPAQHFSGRESVGSNVTLWASWALKGEKRNLYFSGDSGYDTHFKAIGDKLGPFDLVFMENGQYNEMWKYVHILPYQSPKAFEELRGKTFVPIHWGAYDLSLHNWYDPIIEISKQAQEHNINLVAPKLGEVVSFDKEWKAEEWWVPLIKN